MFSAKISYEYTDFTAMGYLSGSWDETMHAIACEVRDEPDLVRAYVTEYFAPCGQCRFFTI